MADITIIQDHAMGMDDARAAAQKVADQMVIDYEMVAEWQDDVLSFKRTGFSGTLALTQGSAQLDITLGIMLKGFSKKIEEQVTKNMAKVFEV
ncbi:MAG: polyhydroxyalkanoic acid system family protein [Oxalobacteraceae bacterium]|jgi:putative polyhydroxyalkanoate system protein|nr:polyhydroxyalkanoic acid system family protein [Oxalobacteraceae bacterium]